MHQVEIVVVEDVAAIGDEVVRCCRLERRCRVRSEMGGVLYYGSGLGAVEDGEMRR